jgi:hypothetical protein
MIWRRDLPTANMATQHPLRIRSTEPQPQFGGYNFSPASWNRRIERLAEWPSGALVCSPNQIISLFQENSFLQALAMIVCWGKMWWIPDSIYGNRPLQRIRDALQSCALSIQETESIANSWATLTGTNRDQLGWTPVMTSKTLHFLCRAIGFNQDPPVPIDNKVILERVWPTFVESIPVNQRPRNWSGNSLDAYNRYMTAVLIWAEQRQWTTTQTEATIFDEYGEAS